MVENGEGGLDIILLRVYGMGILVIFILAFLQDIFQELVIQ